MFLLLNLILIGTLHKDFIREFQDKVDWVSIPYRYATQKLVIKIDKEIWSFNSL